MQRGIVGAKAARQRARRMSHRRNDARQQQFHDARPRLVRAYRVQVRNINPGEGGTWATMVREARQSLRLSQHALAEKLGIDRTTVWRWENKNQRPDTLELTERVVVILHLDRDAALTATGYMIRDPGQLAPPPDPRLHGLDQNDPVVIHIMNLNVDEEMRGFMLDRRREQIAQRNEQDLREIEFWANKGRGAA